MAEQGTTTYKGGKFESFKGSEADKDTKYNAYSQKEIQDAYLSSKGWAGIGGASKRKPGWDQSPEFQEFSKNYAKSKGQKKAIVGLGEKAPAPDKTLPLPNPTPTPDMQLLKEKK